MFLLNRKFAESTPNSNAYVPITNLFWSAPKSRWSILMERFSMIQHFWRSFTTSYDNNCAHQVAERVGKEKEQE
jgi:hypothetical protein